MLLWGSGILKVIWYHVILGFSIPYISFWVKAFRVSSRTFQIAQIVRIRLFMIGESFLLTCKWSHHLSSKLPHCRKELYTLLISAVVKEEKVESIFFHKSQMFAQVDDGCGIFRSGRTPGPENLDDGVIAFINPESYIYIDYSSILI